ncbi:MAG: hypothetical protein KIT73_11595 [Burkholderiales bacterium]|nr:hypothetical protein [Burkholderiales bacterium]
MVWIGARHADAMTMPIGLDDPSRRMERRIGTVVDNAIKATGDALRMLSNIQSVFRQMRRLNQ